MTDTGKLRAKKTRGMAAKRILDDPLIQEAFDKIEAEIVADWKNSAADDERGRYKAYLMHCLLERFKSHFRQLVATGKYAGGELLELEDQTKVNR